MRYSECDLQGVVFNANYLTYLDETITELWRASVQGGYQGMVGRGVDMVVAEATLRFLASARFDDEIDVEADVIRLGTTAMTTELRVVRGSELLVEAVMRHVFVHAGGGGKTEIPEAVRRALEPHVSGTAV